MRRFLLFAMIAAVAAAGCAGEATRDPRADLDRGRAAFDAEQWQEAVDFLSLGLRANPTAHDRGQVHYLRGQALLRLDRRREARADFDRAIAAQPGQPTDAFARIAIGNLFFEDGYDRQAVLTYAPVLKDPPSEIPLDRVLLRLAISLQRLGKWPQADRYLAYLIRSYPRSAAAAEARRRYRADSFSVQTGAYASRTSAIGEAHRLRAAGFEPHIDVAVREQERLHAVRVGKARTYAEAATLARRVQGAGFPALVVP